MPTTILRPAKDVKKKWTAFGGAATTTAWDHTNQETAYAAGAGKPSTAIGILTTEGSSSTGVRFYSEASPWSIPTAAPVTQIRLRAYGKNAKATKPLTLAIEYAAGSSKSVKFAESTALQWVTVTLEAAEIATITTHEALEQTSAAITSASVPGGTVELYDWILEVDWEGSPGFLHGTSSIIMGQTAPLKAVGAMPAVANISMSTAAGLSARGASPGSATIRVAQTAFLRATGIASGSSTIRVSASSAWAAKGRAAATAVIRLAHTAPVAGKAALAAQAVLRISSTASIAARGALTGSSKVLISGAGRLLNEFVGHMVGSSTIKLSDTAPLQARAGLRGQSVLSTSAVGLLRARAALNGTSVIKITAAGAAAARVVGNLVGSSIVRLFGSASPTIPKWVGKVYTSVVPATKIGVVLSPTSDVTQTITPVGSATIKVEVA